MKSLADLQILFLGGAELVEATPVDNVSFLTDLAAAAADVTVLAERDEEASGSIEGVLPAMAMALQPLKRPRQARCVRIDKRPWIRQSKLPPKVFPCSKAKTGD